MAELKTKTRKEIHENLSICPESSRRNPRLNYLYYLCSEDINQYPAADKNRFVLGSFFQCSVLIFGVKK
jgi:hypothetical protein